ncbi:MAG: AsmA family protein [Xanthomonadales bacterium]|nr:AsmA family protein [Xanthomonadales bacterium]
MKSNRRHAKRDDGTAASPHPLPTARRRWLRWMLGSVLALCVLVVAGVVFVMNFDWNGARAWVGERVSRTIGRPFEIRGDLEVQWLRVTDASGERSWLPWPHVFAHDIVVANTEWGAAPFMARVEELAFAISPVPLFGHVIDVPALRLTGADVSLQRDAEGRTNWQFATTGGTGWNLRFGELVLEQGHVRVIDSIHHIDLGMDLAPLDAPRGFEDVLRSEERAARAGSADRIGERAARQFGEAAQAGATERGGERHSSRAYEFAWTAKGAFRGVPVEGRGRAGGVLDFADPDDPFPLQARFSAGKTRIAFVGTLTHPAALDALDLRLWLSGADMADLFPLTGVSLPHSEAFATEGRLNVDFRKGAGAGIYRYEKFTGRVGGSDLSGSLTYTDGEPRGRLTGEVRSQLLQSADLAETFGIGAEAAKASASGRFFTDSDFRTGRWRAMDADVQFAGERIVHARDWPVDRVEARVRMEAGRLRLDPLRFGIAGGRIGGSVQIDGAEKPPQGQFILEARALQMARLLPTLATGDATFGEINGALALAGTGDSLAAVLATADGEVKLLIEHGRVSKALLETAGLNFGNLLLTKLFGDRSVELECAAAQLVAERGVLTPQAFLVDTKEALIEVEGKVDLARERFDLEVKPQAKGLRILSLRSPLQVRGSFLHPEVGVKKGPLIARGIGAVVLGVFAAPAAALVPLVATSRRDDPSRCRDLLARMQGRES